ncbi:MAG: 16S rRNA (cytosine(967)-C(5))-methyltransferase RsmB [Candidatus Eisenbacteria bacterium]
MDARQVALLSLTEWESGDQKIDVVLERQLANADLDDRDTALAQNLTYGVLRWKGRLDWVLDQYVRGGLRSLPLPIRNALRLGLYQVDYLDRIPARAAVNESVNLAKRYGHKGTAGLVNAVLRNVITGLRPDFPPIDADTVAHVSAVYSHPPVLVKRWMDRYGLDMTLVFCEYNNEVPRLVARANGLSCSPNALEAALKSEGRETRPGRYFDECLEILGGGDVTDLQCFRDGLMQVQDESTLASVRLLGPRPGEEIIDMCAAPGGKTTYISELMAGQGRIRAFEISQRRARMLNDNLARLRVKNCEVLCGEATSEVTGAADGILIDAPCSGTGTLGRRIDSRWKFDLRARERVKQDIAELERIHPRQIFAHQASRQLRLLLNAADLVRDGGRIVYSTCTMEPEENERVIRHFLKKRPDFVVEDATPYVPSMFVDGWFVRTLPHKHAIDGAFAARLAKRTGEEKGLLSADEMELPEPEDAYSLDLEIAEEVTG